MCRFQPASDFLGLGYFFGQFHPVFQTPHGRGTFLKTSDGSLYEGYWRDGLFEGKGRRIDKEGSSFAGVWIGGE